MKRNRKFRLLTLPTLVLSAALILSACGLTTEQTASGSTGTSAVNQVASNTNGSAGKTVLTNVSDLYDESFSSRDLSGAYEESEAVTISLNGTGAEASSEAVQINGSTVTITAAGTYILSGTLKNGSVIVNVSKDISDGLGIFESDSHRKVSKEKTYSGHVLLIFTAVVNPAEFNVRLVVVD